MTGRYGFRTGGLTNQTAANPSFKDEPSLAQILKQAGYATGMAGKWRQMCDSPGDWGFDEYITDPTAGGWFWKKTYTKNGQEVTHRQGDLLPRPAVRLRGRLHPPAPRRAVLFLPLRAPDPRADPAHARLEARRRRRTQLYDDNLVVPRQDGRQAGRRARRARPAREDADPLHDRQRHGDGRLPPRARSAKTTGRIGGRHVNGHKGQLLEGGLAGAADRELERHAAPGQVRNDLIDFSDLLPTFAELAGAKLPAGVKFDGRCFAPQLRGEKGNPREWIFVQLGRGWYVRDDGWKLNEKGELFSMKDCAVRRGADRRRHDRPRGPSGPGTVAGRPGRVEPRRGQGRAGEGRDQEGASEEEAGRRKAGREARLTGFRLPDARPAGCTASRAFATWDESWGRLQPSRWSALCPAPDLWR